MYRDAARQLADDLWLLDTFFQGEPGLIASYLLIGPAGAALIDVGSAASLDDLLKSLAAAGVRPAEIRHLVLTHIHLDHAGAAGSLLRLCPHALVYVHPYGAPHLVDPTKLMQSAARIYGDRMQALWGEVIPVPADRIVTLSDGEQLGVGERTLYALHTPGHARHHIAYSDRDHAAVFAGDVAGVRLEEVALVRPPTPPPELLLEDWYASIARIATLDPAVLFLAHFGAVHDVRSHLSTLRTALTQWGDAVLQGVRRGLDEDAIVGELATLSAADLIHAATQCGVSSTELQQRYELVANYRMSAQGYMRYFRTYHPELLA